MSIIDILTFLIDVILIWGISKCWTKKYGVEHHVQIQNQYIGKKYEGKLEQAIRKAAIAEKFAERGFTMASTANLGVIALQKSLSLPRVLTKHQEQRNQLANNEVDKLFTKEGKYDFMMPFLDEEQRAIIEAIEEKQRLEAQQE